MLEGSRETVPKSHGGVADVQHPVPLPRQRADLGCDIRVVEKRGSAVAHVTVGVDGSLASLARGWLGIDELARAGEEGSFAEREKHEEERSVPQDDGKLSALRCSVVSETGRLTREDMDIDVRAATKNRVALVLAGGAARGAYEVGVVDYLLHEVARALGHEISLDVLCGTSVGAFNVCALAAFADEPRLRAQRLVEIWSQLRVADLVRADLRGIFTGARALLDSSGLERLVERSIPFDRIDTHLQAGLLHAVTVSTTHVASGKTVVFVHRREEGLPPWSLDPTIDPRACKLTAQHALASAAIPLLFRAVRLGTEYHCDGGLRQNVPLSPARRLGADRVIVVNPRHIRPTKPFAPAGSEPPPGPLFLLGKTLNALLLDRLDTDLARLDGINRILEAGKRRWGEDFVQDLNVELGHTVGRGVRPLRSLLIRASEDIGRMSAEFVRSAAFTTRVHGPLARIMRRLADGEASRESDLLSYLLFDGEFARSLIALGRADAAARHEELCAFFE